MPLKQIKMLADAVQMEENYNEIKFIQKLPQNFAKIVLDAIYKKYQSNIPIFNDSNIGFFNNFLSKS